MCHLLLFYICILFFNFYPSSFSFFFFFFAYSLFEFSSLSGCSGWKVRAVRVKSTSLLHLCVSVCAKMCVFALVWVSRAVKVRLIHWLQLSRMEGFHSTQFGPLVVRNCDNLAGFLSPKAAGFSEGDAKSFFKIRPNSFPYLTGTSWPQFTNKLAFYDRQAKRVTDFALLLPNWSVQNYPAVSWLSIPCLIQKPNLSMINFLSVF